jgi:3-phosphoshikimate 1-carboxyvinyltransferase
LCATFARGRSTIDNALLSGDGAHALQTAAAFGASLQCSDRSVTVDGVGPVFDTGAGRIDVGNSGTTLRLFTAMAALGNMPRRFCGDASLCSRRMQPLFDALRMRGAQIDTEHADADIPFTVHGPIAPGHVRVDGISSQFVSALLFALPLCNADSEIVPFNLHERPYIALSLHWLDFLGIEYRCDANYSAFTIPGPQQYHPFSVHIPSDFSSAAFALVAAIITGSPLTLTGLDFDDPQGDKELFTICERLGVRFDKKDHRVEVYPPDTLPQGCTIDLNNIPDALPVCAVLGCFLPGITELTNVAQARYKECDRIAVMRQELTKMGGAIEEKPDGLRIRHAPLSGAQVHGHHDHRVVMALAVAGLAAQGETTIDTAESSVVTYPDFVQDFTRIGARIQRVTSH